MPRLSRLLLLLPLLAVASCSDYDKRFIEMRPPMSIDPAAPLAGKWEGSWQSDMTDYHGHLTAIIVPTAKVMVDKIEAQGYTADVRQRLFEFGAYQYDIKLNATTMADGRIHFEGKKDLGYYFGGIVRYNGYILPEKDEFYCDYSSEKDTGTFKMRRITLENQ